MLINNEKSTFTLLDSKTDLYVVGFFKEIVFSLFMSIPYPELYSYCDDERDIVWFSIFNPSPADNS